MKRTTRFALGLSATVLFSSCADAEPEAQAPEVFFDAFTTLARERADACDESLREQVVEHWMAAEAYRQYGLWTEARIQDGIDVGPESSIMKLHWSHLDISLHETALEILGSEAETTTGNGQWMKGYLFGLANPIWGGTSEIQRNIVAERILGLPRK